MTGMNYLGAFEGMAQRWGYTVSNYRWPRVGNIIVRIKGNGHWATNELLIAWLWIGGQTKIVNQGYRLKITSLFRPSRIIASTRRLHPQRQETLTNTKLVSLNFSCLNVKIGFAQLQRTNLPIFLTTLGSTSSKVERAQRTETHAEILINIQNKITCMIWCTHDLYVLTKINFCQSIHGNIRRPFGGTIRTLTIYTSSLLWTFPT